MQASTMIRARTPEQRGPLRSALAVVLVTLGLGSRGPRRSARALAAMKHESASGLCHYINGSAHAPRLLLVHGTPGSAAGWADFLLDPPPGYEVLALDRPGFGHSRPAHALPRLDEQARAVAALLPADGRGAVLLGHSLGGAIAARVAAEQPHAVQALVLVAAALDPAQERVHPLQRIGQWPLVHALLPRAIRNANAELIALEGELRALAPWLAKVRCPVFIVHGTDDALVPPANVGYARERLVAAAGVTVTWLEGHDHFLPWNAAGPLRQVLAVALRGRP